MHAKTFNLTIPIIKNTCMYIKGLILANMCITKILTLGGDCSMFVASGRFSHRLVSKIHCGREVTYIIITFTSVL